MLSVIAPSRVRYLRQLGPPPARLSAVVLGTLCTLLFACVTSPAQTFPKLDNWSRFGWDASRTDSSTSPTGITASNLSRLIRRRYSINGIADSSAVYVAAADIKGRPRAAIFLTTSYGKTISLAAENGAVLWEYSPPGFGSLVGSHQITTAAPAVDEVRGSLYAASPDGYIQALRLENGSVRWRTRVTLSPASEKLSAALTFFKDRVIAVTSGYPGDLPPYVGHVAVLDAETGRLEGVWNSLCSGRRGLLRPGQCSHSGGGIWGRAGAVLDARGDIFVATGNGDESDGRDWGDSVVELSPDAQKVLASYTPTNSRELEYRDQDLGSTAPVLLAPGLIAQGGKDGHIRLISLRMFAQGSLGTASLLQSVQTPSGNELYSAPAVLADATGRWLFAADSHATAGWQMAGDRLARRWIRPNPGTSPVIAGGLLYVYDPAGTLRVYSPKTGIEVARLECGPGHWNSPIVVQGRIVLPEGSANSRAMSGAVDVWTLP